MIFYDTELQFSTYNRNSCISGSQNFIIIFLYFIHLWRKLNSLQRYDAAQNYRVLQSGSVFIPT
jgi:hypothetical protein